MLYYFVIAIQIEDGRNIERGRNRIDKYNEPSFVNVRLYSSIHYL